MEFAGAYVVQGGKGSVAPLRRLLSDSGLALDASDLYAREYSQFGVDEARELSERASTRSFTGSARVFIVAAPSMTSEAQNALLKTLEEPAGDALFFLIHPAPETLLPTLRSRVQRLSVESETLSPIEPKAFLKAAPTERLEMLTALLEKGEDDRRDMAPIITFLSSLERILSLSARKKGAREGLEAVYRARKYAGDKGALLKPLLEQVALLV